MIHRNKKICSPSPVRCDFFEKLTTDNKHQTGEQNTEIDSLIPAHFALVGVSSPILDVRCDKVVMIHYNNINDAQY